MRKLAKWAIIPGLAAAQAPVSQQPAARTPPVFMGPCSNLTCEIDNDWTRNNVLLYMLAGAMPAEKYNFKPTPAQQSFGERVLHVAQVNLAILQELGAKTPPPVLDAQATSKTEAMAALQKVGQYGSAVIQEFGDRQLTGRVDSPPFMGRPPPASVARPPTSTRQRMLYFLMTHSQDTYGQLVVYLRLNGITPPASREP